MNRKGQAKIIATPRVTTLNNEKAKIESKTQIPITTVQPGSSSGGTVDRNDAYVDVPLKLEITPQITDVGTVVLDMLAENSSTIDRRGGRTAPAINNQNMSTRESSFPMEERQWWAVFFLTTNEKVQDRTPGVSQIPVLGNLFKRKGVSRNTNEILFFITPRISRPDYDKTPGKSGVVTSVTLPQAVPLGNPPSNSEQKQGTTVVPLAGHQARADTETTIATSIVLDRSCFFLLPARYFGWAFVFVPCPTLSQACPTHLVGHRSH